MYYQVTKSAAAKAQRQRNQAQPAARVLDALMAAWGCPEQMRLMHLWENWGMVMGADLAALAWPLGHKGRVLLVGGEDPMAMQELQFQTEEILERVNAFMEEDYFSAVKVSSSMGKRPLDVPLPCEPVYCPQEEGERPSGRLLGTMRPDSPVARAYARFARKPLPMQGE
ncbi:MAG: DUF721 domain-containing protein [Desulfovibrionaceae bacterium]|nr:DUF721 domain-containing protein [Desulfovibrionaceae bacterium]